MEIIKIYFTNNWGEDDTKFLKRMKTTTKNNSGVWNNIHFTNVIQDANYILSLGGLPNARLYSYLNEKNLIILQREPDILSKFNEYNIENSFSYKRLYHTWTHPEHMQMNYDDFNSLKYDRLIKIKKCSTITSMRLHSPLARQRVNFITKLCEKYPNMIDVYGEGWDNRLGSSYKGELKWHNLGGFKRQKSDNENENESKYDGLKNYNYSLCFENSSYDNYFTEKFTDCILSWTIPIYFGCLNIDKYFPSDSYYIVDINNIDNIDKVLEIMNRPITEKNIEALKEARELILNKYNIWPTLESIVEKKL